jgi:hypothetical protein
MAVSLTKLRAFKQRGEPFEIVEHDGNFIVMRRKQSVWKKHTAWLRKHHWCARAVIVLGEISLAYMVFVMGLIVGAAIYVI